MTGAQFLPKTFIFDQPLQTEGREPKVDFFRRAIGPWKSEFNLQSALDLGCGVGYYSAMLQDLGLSVTAVDGRIGNIEEARNRYPRIDFRVADAEDPSLTSLGAFDLVACFGLLYHLENPFLVMRSLRALTGKILLLESMVVPKEEPFLVLMDEGPVEDQSLRAISFYPSEGAIIKMAYHAGFPHVYRFRELPDHEDYRARMGSVRRRTVIAASNQAINSPLLEAAVEPTLSGNLWATNSTGIAKFIRRFRRKPKRSRNTHRS